VKGGEHYWSMPETTKPKVIAPTDPSADRQTFLCITNPAYNPRQLQDTSRKDRAPPIVTPEGYVDAMSAAKLLGLSRSAIKTWCLRKNLPYIKPRGRVFIKTVDLYAHYQKGGKQ